MSVKKQGAFITFENVHQRRDIASSRIRGKWLIKYWPETEEYVYGRDYEFIIFQKTYLVDFAHHFKGIKILDVCDPDWNDITNFYDMIEEVDAITCPTEAFRDFLSKITKKPVVVIKDRQDLEYFKEKKIHTKPATEVVWHGYSHNAYVLRQLVNTLSKLNLSISLISNELVSMDAFQTAEGERVKERWTKWDLDTFNQEMIRSDICVLPPVWKPNDRFKSDNKLSTAWALGMPVATNSDELKRFMDPIERQKEAKEKLDLVKKEYDVKDSVKEFKKLIEELKNEPQKR